MRKFAIVIIGLWCLMPLVSANDVEDRFHEVKLLFEARNKSAQNELKQYLKDYPYTTYDSEVQLMMGVLQTERGKYKNALKSFQKVEWKQLTRDEQPMFFFYRGYAYLNHEEHQAAAACFKTLRDSDSPYRVQGSYYYAYCWYLEQDYDRALPEFLDIEHTSQYKHIVPYYIVQIYYAKHQYEEVYDRIRYLLEENPNNPNNAELHRILGEIYYSQGKYDVAATNLKEYERIHQSILDKKGKPKEPLLREDLYLIGMSEYRLGQYQDAIAYFKRVKQLQDTLSENTCLHLGHAYIQVNDREKAKLSYSAAMRFNLSPKVREEAMYNYALTCYESGTALGESIQAFEDFLATYPNTQHAQQVYALMASMYMSSKNYLAAYESIGKVQDPSSKMQQTRQYLRYQIGVDKFVQGKMKECQEWMNEVIANATEGSVYKTEAYYYRAEADYRLQEYEGCIRDVRTFLSQVNVAQSKNVHHADYLLGYALWATSQYSDAESSFRLYLTHADPAHNTYSDALNRIGDCCFNNRQFAPAIEAYQHVIDINKSGVDHALYQQAYAYGLSHRYEDKVNNLNLLNHKYAKSDYADDGLYELARALLQLNRNEDATQAYEQLITRYPHSPLAKQASLELAMTYRNMGQKELAIAAFQKTIEQYPGSKEAYLALENMEQVYVENNDINTYLEYARGLGQMNMNISSQEDSLTYAAAELQYMLGNYAASAAGFGTYLSQFCPTGRYCATATYYAADAHYRMGDKQQAEALYTQLSETGSNQYVEETYTRLAELAFDRQDYAKAREAFRYLARTATQQPTQTAARLGALRCSYQLQDQPDLITVATQLLEDNALSPAVRDEALYNRAKAYLSGQQWEEAMADLAVLAKNVKIETGAEAKYLMAVCYQQIGQNDAAETEIMDFAGMKTPHQYWLAKSFILLSDLNLAKGETFQAKQYLLALQQNYKGEDEIQSIITEKLNAIALSEQPQTIEEEEEL